MAGDASRRNGKRGGRPKGGTDKSTLAAREAIARFVEDNSERLQSWLDQIATSDGPRAAFNCVVDLLEFHIPKLARTEVTGKDGAPVPVTVIHRHLPAEALPDREEATPSE